MTAIFADRRSYLGTAENDVADFGRHDRLPESSAL
jgi:hypothetical protein